MNLVRFTHSGVRATLIEKLLVTETSPARNFTGEDGRSVTLINSPEFGQPKMDDYEVLLWVMEYLEARPNLRVIAMVYLHPINRNNSGRILRIFQHLCGEDYYPNVVLVTTSWNKATDSTRPQWEARENLLRESQWIWEDMINKGASYRRYDDTVESSKNIIEACLCKTDPTLPRFISKLQESVEPHDITYAAFEDAEFNARI